jgi:hypothetical protein
MIHLTIHTLKEFIINKSYKIKAIDSHSQRLNVLNVRCMKTAMIDYSPMLGKDFPGE